MWKSVLTVLGVGYTNCRILARHLPGSPLEDIKRVVIRLLPLLTQPPRYPSLITYPLLLSNCRLSPRGVMF